MAAAVAACGLLGASTGTCMTPARTTRPAQAKMSGYRRRHRGWDRAVYYASRWAIRGRRRRGDAAIIETRTRPAMAGVATSCAPSPRAPMPRLIARPAAPTGSPPITPERVIREGRSDRADPRRDRQGRRYLDAGAGRQPGGGGPGPIIAMMAGAVGSFPIPVTIVPGDLSDEDIDALS